ncbi:MAG: hypothetical protein KKD39_03170 [Candidatus Altiarchaeota archaeon]|nr:hypothetical protein [Candidatus Altiarchaeota archaeon]
MQKNQTPKTHRFDKSELVSPMTAGARLKYDVKLGDYTLDIRLQGKDYVYVVEDVINPKISAIQLDNPDLSPALTSAEAEGGSGSCPVFL